MILRQLTHALLLILYLLISITGLVLLVKHANRIIIYGSHDSIWGEVWATSTGLGGLLFFAGLVALIDWSIRRLRLPVLTREQKDQRRREAHADKWL